MDNKTKLRQQARHEKVARPVRHSEKSKVVCAKLLEIIEEIRQKYFLTS